MDGQWLGIRLKDNTLYWKNMILHEQFLQGFSKLCLTLSTTEAADFRDGIVKEPSCFAEPSTSSRYELGPTVSRFGHTVE